MRHVAFWQHHHIKPIYRVFAHRLCSSHATLEFLLTIQGGATKVDIKGQACIGASSYENGMEIACFIC